MQGVGRWSLLALQSLNEMTPCASLLRPPHCWEEEQCSHLPAALGRHSTLPGSCLLERDISTDTVPQIFKSTEARPLPHRAWALRGWGQEPQGWSVACSRSPSSSMLRVWVALLCLSLAGGGRVPGCAPITAPPESPLVAVTPPAALPVSYRAELPTHVLLSR